MHLLCVVSLFFFLNRTSKISLQQQRTAGAVTVVWWSSGRQVNGLGISAYWTLSHSWWAYRKGSQRLYRSSWAHWHRMLAEKKKEKNQNKPCYSGEASRSKQALQSPPLLQTLSSQSHTTVFWVTAFLQTSSTRKRKRNKKIHSSHLLAPEFSPFPDGISQPSEFLKPSRAVQHEGSCCSCSVTKKAKNKTRKLHHCTRLPKTLGFILMLFQKIPAVWLICTQHRPAPNPKYWLHSLMIIQKEITPSASGLIPSLLTAPRNRVCHCATKTGRGFVFPGRWQYNVIGN